ncbi:DUF3592 domain-containing protein [Flavobacterium sp. BFFFF1]|uniref:DUF3592 domain-containing protein n=1 Tax=Flavobacterium sp. BFFFF1 TaxID=2015557 RepID=UPI0025BB8CA7|nr:DUF3592 domain-containing protein [Flavobacterium sp. BFFFF1]
MKWIIFLASLVYFIYFIPKEIIYPKYKPLIWIVFALIFVALPFLVFKTVNVIKQNLSSGKIIGICALSILIIGPTSAIFQKYRENEVLNLKGRIVNGYVFDRKKSKNDWLINCKYVVNGEEYTTYYNTDEENKYRIGDTVKLTYNKEFPRMYRIEFN